ncbi:ROK family transcriptional regulator [Streptomyces hoynatensis]|uniref:ROK family transcriptional regulator n=1 Tax=Streptomyces hoynatensis TaxID=1141874 RepID=A0A3A9Z641_9ACTN|nr:ROK family transcriptional regulator [Streptomyces hoynatensis]
MTSEQRGDRPSIEAWEAVSPSARPIIRELLVTGPRTRTELARRLGLSTGSLTRLTKPLVRCGLLVERGIVHDETHGHPTRPLDLVAGDYHFLGVKITADGMYGVVTDLRAEVVAEHAEPLGARTPEAVAAQVAALRDRLARESVPPVAAGVTLGGNPSPLGGAGQLATFDAPFLGWRQVPLESVLHETLKIPCVVRNDVAALAHGQHWFGAARGLTDFALVTIGAGIGYALCLGGRVLESTEEDLVEFGHHILDPGGPMCPVGHRGCVGSYLSTEAILSAAAYGLHRPVQPEEIARRAGEGNAVCQDIVRQGSWALGVLAATIANLTGVKTVLIAGESLEVVRAGRRHIAEGMRRRRLHHHRPIDMRMLSSSFSEWARGGAVEAVRTFVVEGR